MNSPLRRSAIGTILRLALGAALLGILFRTGILDWEVLKSLSRGWPWMLGGFVLACVAVAANSLRLWLLVQPRGFGLGFGAAIKLNLVGMFFNQCLPGFAGGEAVRIYYALKGMKGSRTEVTSILLFDRVMGMLALMLFPVLMLPFFFDFAMDRQILRLIFGGFAVAAAGITIGFLLCFSKRIHGLVQRTPLLAPGRRGHLIRRVYEVIRSYRDDLSALLAALGTALLGHAMALGVLATASAAVQPGPLRPEILLLAPAGFVANVLPLTPGGLGVGETAMDALFRLAGMPGGAEAMLAFRVILLIVSLPGLAFYLRGRRVVFQAPQAPV